MPCHTWSYAVEFPICLADRYLDGLRSAGCAGGRRVSSYLSPHPCSQLLNLVATRMRPDVAAQAVTRAGSYMTAFGCWLLSVLVIDLNGLKQVNDEDGHVAGDALLRRAGEVLGKVNSPNACVARTGGDEFAMLLPGADERGAQAAMERIQSVLVLNNQFYSGRRLSMAIGSATCHVGDQLEPPCIGLTAPCTRRNGATTMRVRLSDACSRKSA